MKKNHSSSGAKMKKIIKIVNFIKTQL